MDLTLFRICKQELPLNTARKSVPYPERLGRHVDNCFEHLQQFLFNVCVHVNRD